MKITRSLQLDRTLSLHDATPPARAPKPGTAHSTPGLVFRRVALSQPSSTPVAHWRARIMELDTELEREGERSAQKIASTEAQLGAEREQLRRCHAELRVLRAALEEADGRTKAVDGAEAPPPVVSMDSLSARADALLKDYDAATTTADGDADDGWERAASLMARVDECEAEAEEAAAARAAADVRAAGGVGGR